MTDNRCCDDCGLPKPTGPMLYDKLWRTISPNNPWLCFDCTEKRLGRSLTQADLRPRPYNAGWIPFDRDDVAARQFGSRAGRKLLAPR